jgi:hypothetical protein
MRALLINLFIITSLVYQGCSGSTTVKEETTYTPSFKFTPSSNATPGSAEVTFAIVGASYSDKEPWTQEWPFPDFSDRMSLDFQEILSARGFTVRGPYKIYDEMTFPDKKGSDLVLEPNLKIEFNGTTNAKKNFNILGGPDTYSLNGTMTISGRVTLSLLESLSKERMWFKSIELSPISFNWESDKDYTTPNPGYIDNREPGVSKPLGLALESFYKQIMETSWKYLDPEEMKIVKKQSEEIRAKKVY